MTLAVPGDGALSGRSLAGHTVSTRVPGLTIAAMTSLGAGAIQAAVAGVHAEHPQLARVLIICAIAQFGAGMLALARPNRLMAALVLVVNVGAVGGWLATRLTGVSWIDGLQSRQTAQFADSVSALLGATAVGCALAAAMIGARRSSAPRLSFPALAVAALTIPAMLSGGTSLHSQTATPAAAAGTPTSVVDESQPHNHAANAAPVAVVDPTQTHTHTTDPAATGSTPTVTATATAAALPWPRPWDPTKPIDVSGVPGVTPEQEARATKLIEDSLKDLPKYADPATAIADGYASIGDAATGDEHYIKTSLIEDNVFLDPTQPESLVYKVDGAKRTLAGAMYIASARPTDDPSLLAFAGPLMQWHNHGNLCWALGPDGHPRVVGITDANGHCANGINTGGQNPMVHVWITPHPCGVFAALEGVGAGQAAVPDSQRVDLCNQPHTHPGATASTTP
ncbi:MAG: hypothetical protein ACXV8K_17285 [Ilumatobacteraceae bacterium]